MGVIRVWAISVHLLANILFRSYIIWDIVVSNLRNVLQQLIKKPIQIFNFVKRVLSNKNNIMSYIVVYLQ